MVLLLEVAIVGKDGAFTDLLDEICHVVCGGIPCLAHSFCVGVDVEGVDLAPFVKDAVVEGDEGAVWDAGEEILELEAIFTLLELALGEYN